MLKNQDFLKSWKEIAAYLGWSVSTVQRRERTLHLPVRRVRGTRGSVIALKVELDHWLQHTQCLGTSRLQTEIHQNTELLKIRRARLLYLTQCVRERTRQTHALLEQARKLASTAERMNGCAFYHRT